MRKYFFLKTIKEGGRNRLVPLPGQTDDYGNSIREDWHVAASRETRDRYPNDAEFCTVTLSFVSNTHYSAGPLYIMNHPAAVPAHEPNEDMVAQYEKLKGKTPVAATPKKKASSSKKKVAAPTLTLRDKILAEIPMPSILTDGFFVEQKTFTLIARNILQGVNTLLFGPSGTGKTEMILAIAQRAGCEVCTYDMGSMHDPMTQMLGTHRIDADHKSVFDYSRFVSDISDAPREGYTRRIILLDELSRAPLTTMNILLPCLDSRRVLPVEMAGEADRRQVPVHPDVVFIATANIGAEYTGTQELDKALKSRFMPLSISYLPNDEEERVLVAKTGVETDDARNIVSVAEKVRRLYAREELETDISTRETLRAAALVADGWSCSEAMEVVFLPLFTGNDTEGERSIVRKIFMSY
jgi:nitric oxide reductase NorQ protein